MAEELGKLGHAHARPDRNRGEGMPENMRMVRPRACDLRPLQGPTCDQDDGRRRCKGCTWSLHPVKDGVGPGCWTS